MPAFPYRAFLAAALLTLSLGSPAAPATPAAVAFDTTPRAGQHQRQSMDIQATIRMRIEPTPEATGEQRAKINQAAENFTRMGPMKVAVKMAQAMKVGQPDAGGWLPLTVTTSSKGGEVEVGGKVQPLPQKAQDLAFTARFNPKDFAFEIQGVSGAPALDELLRKQGNAMVGEALQLYKVLAQKPLQVGESVEVPMTMALPIPLPGGAGTLQNKLRYTLVRVDRGVASFDMAMDMTMDINAPLPGADSADSAASAASAASSPAADGAAKVMAITMAGTGKGSSTLRMADGLPLTSQLKMVLTITMKMPDNGLMLMDMDMDMRAKGESLAKPAPARSAAKRKP
jgi:hypothetical protein